MIGHLPTHNVSTSNDNLLTFCYLDGSHWPQLGKNLKSNFLHWGNHSETLV